MAEALAHAVVDLSGRATSQHLDHPDPGMATHAFQSLAQNARITLHVTATGGTTTTARRGLRSRRRRALRPKPSLETARLLAADEGVAECDV